MSSKDEVEPNELVLIRRRAPVEEGGHHGGVWKIAYADFMTAMMAFFLVMWLINSAAKETLTQVATYFNPLRLSDYTPTPKGLHTMESGAQGKQEAVGNSKQQDGKARSDAPSDPSSGKRTEQALFNDPYGLLEKLAAEADGRGRPEIDAEKGERDARLASGEAFRDPFDPAFRRERREAEDVRIVQDANREAVPQAKDSSDPSDVAGRAPQAAAIDRALKADDKVAAAAKEIFPKDEVALNAASRAMAEEANKLETQIKQVLKDTTPGTLPNIDVTVTEEGLLISLTDDQNFGMFAVASAEPRPALVVVMEKIAKLLAPLPQRLVVRGHTDGRPYRSATYDNWRLSTARAHMAYYMLVRGGIDENRFERIEGYADRSLRIAQDPEAAQNRRIEILMRKAKP